MSDPTRSTKQMLLPPPAPPLPPSRPGAWQRLVGPLGFGQPSQSRPPIADAHRPSQSGHRTESVRINSYPPLPSQTAVHRTGLPIAALDINGERTHAVLAGQEILKTIHVAHGKVTEEVNLRSAVNAFNSAHTSGRRKFLPALDVKWSHGNYSHIIATAAVNGPIVLYNVTRGSELASLHEHRNQVHKLAFNPHDGCLLLSGGQDGAVKMWDFRNHFSEGKAAPTMKSSKQFSGRTGAVRDVRWSPTEIFEFVTGSDNGVIQKWDLRNVSSPVLRVNGHQKPCVAVDWHPDGQHVVSGGFDRYVRVWDFKSGKNIQKPVFELKTPQAIMNIRWRPACWSAEVAGTGYWQSTQLITSYTQDDPRLHVWDLRRPYLPFRELDRYNRPATGLLWASKDLLWTVGKEGAFTQNDVSFAPQVHTELSPCAMHWAPDGEFVTFAEDRSSRRESGLEDPAVGFLGVRHQKLSSGEEETSRSLTDDESALDGLLSTSHKRRQSKATSARSAKSQASTPPSMDGFSIQEVLSLKKAAFERKDLFNNKQVGVIGSILGVAAEPEVVKYLARSYSPAPTEDERRAQPDRILRRLEEAFKANAEACDAVSMHRTAQTWRILGAVIVPELKAWADKNRTDRLTVANKMQRSPNHDRERLEHKGNPDKVYSSPKTTEKAVRSQKVMSNLFKGVLEVGKLDLGHEIDNTSNMTTPLARPLTDLPLLDTSQSGGRFQNLDETMEVMPPLPPSVLTAHSAATIASKALLQGLSSESETPPSSPEKLKQDEGTVRRHNRKDTSESVQSIHGAFQTIRTTPRPIQKDASESSAQPQRHEDRRAALRDYRAQARPLVTFDGPMNSPQERAPYGQHHDSSDSFPMFSASTDSSHKDRSIGESFNSPDLPFRAPATPEEWQRSQNSDDFEPCSPPSDESGKQNNLSRRFQSLENGSLSNPEIVHPKAFGLGLDGQTESIESAFPNTWVGEEESIEGYGNVSSNLITVSSSPEHPFHLELPRSIHAPQVHSFNPLRSHLPPDSISAQPPSALCPETSSYVTEDLLSPGYVFGDFRPIDLSQYDPSLPFAWSSFPLIAHAITFDLSTGPACGQFSAFLLMYLYPYFFHQSFAHITSGKPTNKRSLAERLMEPRSGRRIIESIFLNHSAYLSKMRLFVQLAELRKVCMKFDFPSLYSDGSAKGKSDRLDNGDVYFLSVNCLHCQSPMTDGKIVCTRCRSVRDVCPVCLSLRDVQDYGSETDVDTKPQDESVDERTTLQGMWTLCHSCGHGAHFRCIVEWLSHPSSQGACPSQGCGCDCGPGMVRRQRIDKQIIESEMRLLQGATVPSLKKDHKKAEPSPAVHKTRYLLREGERSTQSGDERGSTTLRRGSGSRGGFGGQSSQKKSVRLVTPREEKASGQG